MSRNGWRIVWLITVYDCPMTSPQARQDYTVFRRELLRENFMQLQNSLYVRNYPSMAAAESAVSRLKPSVPSEAKVAFFLLTDKQYGLTREFFGPRPSKKRPDLPEQIGLFQ